MGLMDYYSYGSSSYSPLGGHDRRDHNVFDQNPYSKRLLGWITPNVVVGNVSTVTLNTSSSEKDSVLVIPDDDYTPEFDSDGKLLFNPFDEYLLVDCFANQNRNKYGWDIYQREALSSQGGRVYHVDSRLMDVINRVLVDDSSTLLDSPRSQNADRPISNSDSGTRAEVAYGLPSSYNAYDEKRNTISRPCTKQLQFLFRQGSLHHRKQFHDFFLSEPVQRRKVQFREELLL